MYAWAGLREHAERAGAEPRLECLKLGTSWDEPSTCQAARWLCVHPNFII
jgi:hypothetical protein